jgi:hypothetical protein
VSKVTRFVEGFTNTGHFPYVYAALDCGHSTSVTLRATMGTCCSCGARRDIAAGRCPCGAWAYKDIDAPREHNPADRITKIGDEFACETCARKPAEVAAMRAALLDPDCSHTRYRDWCGSGTVTCYRRDPSSPSGVLASAALRSEWFDELYSDLRAAGLLSSGKSPLSPTEGLRGR